MLVAWLVLGAQTLPEHAEACLVPLYFRHDAPVREVAYPGNRRHLYTLDAAGVLRAWEVESGRQLYRVPAEGFQRLVAAANGSVLALSSPDDAAAQIRVIDAATGKALRVFAGARKPAFSADGTIVAGADLKILRRWKVSTGEELPPFDEVRDLTAVALSPDGSKVAAAFLGGIALWNGGTGERLGRRFAEESWPSSCLSFSPDGASLAAGGLWGTMLFGVEPRLSAGRPLDALAGKDLAFSKTGLLSLHRGRLAQAWSLPDGEPLGVWRAKGDVESERLFLSSDGEAVVRARGHGVRLHAAGARGPDPGVTLAAFLPDGRVLSGSRGCLQVWKLETGWIEETTLLPSMDIVGASRDASRLLLREKESIAVWDRSTKDLLFRKKIGDFPVCALSPDGTKLVVYGGQRCVIHDLAAGNEREGPRGQARIHAMAFSPDGRLLVKAEEGGGLTFARVEGNRDVLSIAGRSDASVACVAFSPDGTRVATGEFAGAVRIWEEGKEPRLVHSLEGCVGVLAFSPDGSRILAGSRRTGLAVISLREPYGPIATLYWTSADPTALAFSADGRRLLTGSSEGALYLWKLPEKE